MPLCIACRSRLGRTAKFCSRCGAGQPVDQRPIRAGSAQILERRFLTVLFCDLVGSTQLATALEPERLAEIILAYREIMQMHVAKLGGVVAQYLGDGLLAYFGFPSALDDDAVRAVETAIGMLGVPPLLETQFRQHLPPELGIRIRVGIHSGLVVIEAAKSGAAGLATVGAIGQTPNIAARLQELAVPGTVLVTGATYGLTATTFDYEARGETKLKGIDGSVAIFRPLGLRQPANARTVSILAPRVEVRSREFAQLRNFWSHAIAGEGAAILLTGDGGVGKTFLVSHLARQAKIDGGVVIRFPSFFDATYSPFRAVLAGLQRQFLLTAGDPKQKAARLARVLRRFACKGDILHALLGEFLSLPGVRRDALPKLTRDGRQILLRDLLLTQLAQLRSARPVMIVVENAHWADPSSQEWLAELIRQARPLRIMLLITTRPDLVAPWSSLPFISSMRLDRLDPADLDRILTVLEKGKPLNGETRQAIIERSDGVPLFLEELYKIFAGHNGGAREKARTQTIPDSLIGMLTARLDRMGGAKRIALAASVIGRDFSLDLLRELGPTRPRDLARGLSALVEEDLVQRKLERSVVFYSFRHSLLRDAAYEMLLSDVKRDYHARLAAAYPKCAMQVAAEQPEIVAHHASLGGLADQALTLWRRAGLLALDRSAYREATQHLDQALAETSRLQEPLPPSAHARLCTELVAAKIGAEGFAAPDVERFSIQAYELCADLPDPVVQAAAIGGLTTFYQVRGPLSLASNYAERLIEFAQAGDDPGMIIRATRRLGWCCFCRGEVEKGRGLLTDALAMYEERRDRGLLHRREIDAGVIGLVNLAWAESFAGDETMALAHCKASQALALEQGERPADMAYALSMSASTYQVLGDHPGSVLLAEQALEIAARNALPYWSAWSKVLLGWGLIRTDPRRALPTILNGAESYAATGARLFVPYNLGLAAEAALALGQVGLGLDLIDQAKRTTAETEVRFSEAGLQLTLANLLQAAGNKLEADEQLASADALAQEQGSLVYLKAIQHARQSGTQVC